MPKNLFLLLLTSLFLIQARALADDTNSDLSAAGVSKNKTRWAREARENRQMSSNIVWLTHEPLDFLLRRGDHFDDEPQRYAEMGTPTNLQIMADAGVRATR